MRTKKLIKRRNNITQRWQFCSPIASEKGGEKRKNKCNNMGYSYLVTHPSTNATEQGLTLLRGRNLLLSLWYSASTLLKAFFKFLR